jgi:hypothetical protein
LANKLTDYVKTYFDQSHKSDIEFKLWIDNIMQAKKILN